MELTYIRQILEGDATKFSYFVETYKHMAYSIAFRIVNDREDAEEIVQDSFLKTFKSLRKFRADSKFSTWFYKIVVNTSLSRLKKKEPSRNDIDIDDVSDQLIEDVEFTYLKLARVEQQKFINLALETLGMEDRLIMTLYYLSESSIDEICEITTISKENIKMKLYRARKKMYDILKGLLKSEIRSIV